MKVGRNEPCPCGSGKKYKHCCLNKDADAMPLQYKLMIAVFVLVAAAGLISFLTSLGSSHEASSVQRDGLVWSEEHQHWH